MDPTTLVMLAVLAVLIIFMFRNSRKRKAQAEELRTQIVPGKEVMTNFGLFGTLVSIDEVSNVAEIETSPGVIVRVHRQTVAKVVDASDDGAPRSVEEAMERANREAEQSAALDSDVTTTGEPAFGERVDAPLAETPTEKSTSEKAASKKSDD